MQLSFGGNEPPWTLDLSGTSAVVNAMADCFRAHHVSGLAFPFGEPMAVAAQGEPTQPFGAAPPAEPPSSTAAPPAPAPVQVAAPPPVAALPAALPAPPQAAQPPSGEQVVASWSGSGRMQTRPFHVDGPWELQWTRAAGYFSAELHPAFGTAGGNQLLANGSNADSSTSYQPRGGDFYLEFDSRERWTARIVAVPRPGSPDPAAASGYPGSVAGASSSPETIPVPRAASAAQPRPDPDAASDRQTAFLAAVDAARDQYRNASNDMAKGAARPTRAQAICRSLPSAAVRGWTGTIETLTTNGDGKGVISIGIGRGVSLKTWNNSLSDISDHTLIEPASALFQAASVLRPGEAVRFSAALFPSDVDCYHEASLTMDGSITRPEFIMRLVAIAPAVP